MLCTEILGTTHHGTYKKVIDVLFENKELGDKNFMRVARDGVELDIRLDCELQDGDILAENEFYVYAVKAVEKFPEKKKRIL
ncbi:hypothetical protein [Fibrobacter sp. UWEL]|uniref:hypothetical protein n=1 Tax=Fibrobacter sp. UWEL TaxID=1896209 RepID=UPI00091374EF|nr:hypothetical protein [Fibrobacter sp. UWEL]SHK68528.1 hypothetical protein SAMN05720468_10559 [Fibrobacter sp. UWEL]